MSQAFSVGSGAPASQEVWSSGFNGSIPSSALGNRFGFHGRSLDDESGMIYVRNRYFDSELGRFVTADLLGYIDGPSPYQFAGYSPFEYSDPYGLCLGVTDRPCAQVAQEIDHRLVWFAKNWREFAGLAPPNGLQVRADTAAFRLLAAPVTEALRAGEQTHHAMALFGEPSIWIDLLRQQQAIHSGEFSAAMGGISIEMLRVGYVGQVGRMSFAAVSPVARELSGLATRMNPLAFYDDLGLTPMGFPKIAPRLVARGWRLSFDKGSQTWTSPGGLIFGHGSTHGNRIKHVLAHGVPDPSKPIHSVFNVPRNQILPLVDEAWAARGAVLPGDPGAFVIPMGRPVGTAGETAIKIIVRPNTSEIITAYPVVP